MSDGLREAIDAATHGVWPEDRDNDTIEVAVRAWLATHQLVQVPNWDTKQHCACGFVSVSKCEWALHALREFGVLS